MRGRLVVAAAAGCAAAVYALHAILTDRVVDDCYITFRYVRNWVGGFGPVFNPGDRVEGYTNFLWMAFLAAIHRAAPQLDLLAVARGLSFGCGALVLTLVARFSFARRERAGVLRAFAPILLALHAPFVLWTTSGLETLFFTALVFSAAIAELATESGGRGGWRAPLLLALATMTRPDGIVFVVALAAHRAGRPGAGAKLRWRPAAAALLLFLLVYAPYWWWRWRYYGRPLPNTFYAKVGGGLAQWVRGAIYLRDWTVENGVLLTLLPAVALVRGWRESWVRLMALFAAAGGFFALSVGGDSLGFYRFLVPIAPFAALLAQEPLLDLVERCRESSRAAATTARTVVACAVTLMLIATARPSLGPALLPDFFHVTERQTGLTFPSPTGEHTYRWFDNYFVDRLSVAGRWLDHHAPPDALVAASPAGAVSYQMRQPMLDMLGLNDVHIANVKVQGMGTQRAGHEKGDGPYVLSRRPRYVLLGNVSVFERPSVEADLELRSRKLKSERELFADPEFHRLYKLVSVPIGDAELSDIAPKNRHLFQWLTFYELIDPPPR